jgi:hypothetical protein
MKKKAAPVKKAAAKNASVGGKKKPVPARSRGSAGGAQKAVVAKKAPARRGTRRGPRSAAAGGDAIAETVLRVIGYATSVRPVLLHSTLASLAIHTSLKIRALAAELGRAFDLYEKGLPDEITAGTTVAGIITLIRGRSVGGTKKVKGRS